MMRAGDIKAWLDTFQKDELIGIDDGGLTLRPVEDLDEYLEVGGLPEDE